MGPTTPGRAYDGFAKYRLAVTQLQFDARGERPLHSQRALVALFLEPEISLLDSRRAAVARQFDGVFIIQRVLYSLGAPGAKRGPKINRDFMRGHFGQSGEEFLRAIEAGDLDFPVAGMRAPSSQADHAGQIRVVVVPHVDHLVSIQPALNVIAFAADANVIPAAGFNATIAALANNAPPAIDLLLNCMASVVPAGKVEPIERIGVRGAENNQEPFCATFLKRL